MRIFLAGATGAIGKRLVPKLVRAGHDVVGTTRSGAKAAALEAAGATPAIVDALDRDAVIRMVEAAQPDVIVHQLTALPSMLDLKHFDDVFSQTNLLRTRGTDILLDAAARAGVRRFVAQSFAGWPFATMGGEVKDEHDPFDDAIPESMRRTLDAIRYLESRVTGTPELDGIVLRYAMLYGPKSVVGDGIETMLRQVRARRMPVVGSGAGVWSFVHIDDAAEATRIAIEKAKPGIYQIADDEPVRAAELFRELAHIVGAKPPRHVPVWLARMLVGQAGVRMMTQMRGVSNRKAKEALGWRPRWSWRDGFRDGISESAVR